MHKTQSDTLKSLRFPLIVAVVFIHSFDNNLLHFGSHPWFANVQYLFSQVFARIAVPTFYFVSGYLFFFNIDNWTQEIYRHKLQRRLTSLFIPYIFWISSAVLIFFVAQQIPALSPFFSGVNKRVEDYAILDFLQAFWVVKPSISPILYQFWFIRDLIVIILLSPLIYYFLRHLKYFGIFILFAIWFTAPPYLIAGLSFPCLFFFSLGAFFSIYKINALESFYQIRQVVYIYPFIAFLDFMVRGFYKNQYIHNTGVALGMISFINLMYWLTVKKEIKPIEILASASFFVFAFHEPWLSLTKKSIAYLIRPNSEVAFLLIYFTTPILVILLSLAVYVGLKKTFPTFLRIISGGR